MDVWQSSRLSPSERRVRRSLGDHTHRLQTGCLLQQTNWSSYEHDL
jgi:hypothetical protein